MGYELNISLIGITVVFVALIGLSLIIFIFSKFFSAARAFKDNNKSINIASIKDTQGNDIKNEELIAVLTAAVVSSMREKTMSKIKVKSYRRIPQTSPVWNMTGRMEQILSKL
jgi:glutaconyl-CoA/methylmalonyl-CoA decarboxylase subunit delta